MLGAFFQIITMFCLNLPKSKNCEKKSACFTGVPLSNGTKKTKIAEDKFGIIVLNAK